MAEYNLSEFRKNTRKAFDEAEKGEPVYIDRYGEDFILISKKNWQDTLGSKHLDSKVITAIDRGIDNGSVEITVKTHEDGTLEIVGMKHTPPLAKPATEKNNSDSHSELPGVGEL